MTRERQQDLITSSYAFHLQLETPLAFARREWKAITLFAGGFCTVMIAAVLFVDPAFFYPRLQTDPLNYYLKARSLVETGTTAARWAVNLPPFPYVSMPGVLRAPLLIAFDDFDDQLRAMQLINIPIVASVALLSAYIFSWTQPERRHWMVIGFAFAFTLASPIWIANVFLPLADAPYAAFTLAAWLIAVELIRSPKRPLKRAWLIGVFVVLFIIAFMLRFTAPVLLVSVAVLARARSDSGTLPTRLQLTVGMLAAVLLVVLIGFNAHAIFGKYLSEPLFYLAKGDKLGMILNLLTAAAPSQIIPSFQLGFVHPPVNELHSTTFGDTPTDIAWATVGFCISGIVIAGMWVSRSRFLPELWYTLVALPVLTVVLPSTTRYLMSYQPFFWIFFYLGAAYLAARFAPWIKPLVRSRAVVSSVAVAALAIVVGLRAWKVAGTGSERYFAVTLNRLPEYVSDVSSTFRALRNFIETLPRNRTLLIGGRGAVGRWKVISGRDYYHPDTALATTSRVRDVYLLVECGTLEVCQSWDGWKRASENEVTKYGRFEFDSVFAIHSEQSRVEVLRVLQVK